MLLKHKLKILYKKIIILCRYLEEYDILNLYYAFLVIRQRIWKLDIIIKYIYCRFFPWARIEDLNPSSFKKLMKWKSNLFKKKISKVDIYDKEYVWANAFILYDKRIVYPGFYFVSKCGRRYWCKEEYEEDNIDEKGRVESYSYIFKKTNIHSHVAPFMYNVPTKHLLQDNTYMETGSIYWYVIGIEKIVNLRIKLKWYYTNIRMQKNNLEKIKKKTPGFKDYVILPINFREIFIKYLGKNVTRLVL